MLNESTKVLLSKEKKNRKKKTQISKSKFVKNHKDQKLKDKFGDSFSYVYYALKKGSNKETVGLTATDIFFDIKPYF